MKEEFFKRLKEKREKLNLEIKEVVEKTKLHPSVIKAIEEGRLEEINPVYLKGFVKIYASFLGEKLDEDVEKSLFSQGEKKEIKSKREYFTPHIFFSKLFLFISKIKKFLFFSIIFFLIFFSCLFFFKLFKRKAPSHPLKRRNIAVKEKSRHRISASKEINVSLTVKKECFLKVLVDGEVVFEGILRKGSIENWQAKKEIELRRISDGSAIEVEVNGELLPSLSKIHKPVKSLRITSTKISVVK